MRGKHLITREIAAKEYSRLFGVRDNDDVEKGYHEGLYLFRHMSLFTDEELSLTLDEFSVKFVIPLFKNCGNLAGACVGGRLALTQKETPKPGEWWWVKTSEACGLDKFKIMDVTEKTIQVSKTLWLQNLAVNAEQVTRYKKEDIDLVERCEDQGEEK